MTPEADTVYGLGNRKNRYFRAWLAENAVEAFPGTRALIAELAAAGIRAAVFSSSQNARDVLQSPAMLNRFEVIVDGQDMASTGLPGKPHPAIKLRAAEQLGVTHKRTAIVEDAISGVEAGAAGSFAQVVGVDRKGDGAALADAGADLVVADLAELAIGHGPRLIARLLPSLPRLRDRNDDLRVRLERKRLIFLLPPKYFAA